MVERAREMLLTVSHVVYRWQHVDMPEPVDVQGRKELKIGDGIAWDLTEHGQPEIFVPMKRDFEKVLNLK